MRNGLPSFKSFTIEDNARNKKYSSWIPEASTQASAKVLRDLSNEISKETDHIEYSSKIIGPDPNSRDLEKKLYDSHQSPLCSLQRGAVEPISISMPKFGKEETKTCAKQTTYNSSKLSAILYNFGATDIDIYVQKEGAITSNTVSPRCKFKCAYAGKRRPGEILNEDLFCLVAPLCNVSAVTSGRQDQYEFDFLPGPIGLQVEIIHDKLVCTGVVPDSQASQFETLLMEAFIIAVNGKRVLDTSNFQEAVQASQGRSAVKITAMCFRGGKKKIDDLYTHDFSQKNTVKSLLSGILNTGIDDEHQHDIVLPSGKDSDDDDSSSDNNDEEISKPHISTQQMPKDFRLEKEGLSEGDGHGSIIENDDGLIAHHRPKNNTSNYNDDASINYGDPIIIRSSSELKIGDDTKLSDNDEEDNPDQWDYTTALEKAEVVPYLKLLCVPSLCRQSKGWGHPKESIQITNLSRSWTINLYWIDEESAFIKRKTILGGDKHVDMISEDHVWAVVVTPVNHNHYQPNNDLTLPPGDASYVLVSRFSAAALQSSSSSVIIWAPGSYVSLSQRLIVQETGGSVKSEEDELKTKINIQIFDLKA